MGLPMRLWNFSSISWKTSQVFITEWISFFVDSITKFSHSKKKSKNHKDMSTCGGLHSIGSDVTRTGSISDAHHNGLGRIESGATRRRERANTSTSRIEPVTSRESFVPGAEDARANEKTNHYDEMDIIGSKSTQDKSFRKASTVKEPILQHAKRQKSQAA